MGQRPAQLTPELSPWHRWGAELRRARTARNLSLAELGERVHASRSHLAKLERAQRPVTREWAAACDRALDLAGGLVSAWEQAAAAASPQQVGVAGGTRHVPNVTADVSNPAAGLVTAGGHEESSDDGDVICLCRLRDGRITIVTIPRRSILLGGMAAAMGAIGFGSPAAGGTSVESPSRLMRAASAYGATPVEHLRKLRQVLIDSDNLLGAGQVLDAVHEQIRVIHALRRDSRAGRDRRELLELQTQFAEFASWLHQDVGEHQAAARWLDRALPWSHAVGDRELTCYVMARKAQLAADLGDGQDVIDLAEASGSMAAPDSRLAAVASTYEGVGHALAGDYAGTDRAFEHAQVVVAGAAADPSPWGAWLDNAYVQVHRAQGLDILGRSAEAAAAFDSAIAELPDGYSRDRGVYLARAAVAHAGAGAPEQAAAMGLQALGVAETTGSGRILTQLARLDGVLQPWADAADVVEFRSALDELAIHQA